MTDKTPHPDLEERARTFAEQVSTFLKECFEDAPAMEVTLSGSRARVSPSGQGERAGGVPLRAAGEQLAWLRIDFHCRMDSTAEFLSVDSSKIWIVAEVDATPIFRFEYLHDADWVPHSHIQVHGERGALSHLLTKTDRTRPHMMATLHLPTGGSRFRPGLEDVVQFLVNDCRFDALTSWRDAVLRERAEWRKIQARTVCRDLPEEAAKQLQKMGYEVTPPRGGHPAPALRILDAW